MADQRFNDKGNALGRVIKQCEEALIAARKTVRGGWRSYNDAPGRLKELNADCLFRELTFLKDEIDNLSKIRGWNRRRERLQG